MELRECNLRLDRPVGPSDLPDTHLEPDGREHKTVVEGTGRNVGYLLLLINDLRERLNKIAPDAPKE